jgi:hypothetical protein
MANHAVRPRTTSSRRRPVGRRLAVLAIALVAAGALAGPAQADRVYSGKATHYAFDLAPDAEPYVTSFVVRANDRRITGIHVEVRLECIPISIIDLRYSKFLRRGPKLGPNGGFELFHNGITVRGRIGKRSAAGTVEAVKGGCKSPGARWTARKRRTL